MQFSRRPRSRASLIVASTLFMACATSIVESVGHAANQSVSPSVRPTLDFLRKNRPLCLEQLFAHDLLPIPTVVPRWNASGGQFLLTSLEAGNAPVAKQLELTTPEETAISFALGATDAENDPISYRITILPLGGTLIDGAQGGHVISASELPYTVTNPGVGLTYVPRTNYNNTQIFLGRPGDEEKSPSQIDKRDRLRFVASDGQSESWAYVYLDVTPVQDAPTLYPNPTIRPRLNEVAQGDTSGSGTTITQILNSTSPYTFVTDPEELVGLAIVGTDTSQGSWEYSTDGTTWKPLGDVSHTSARLLGPTNSIRFVASPSFRGSISAGLTVRGWDRTTGTEGELADTSVNGGTTAFSTATGAVAVTIREADSLRVTTTVDDPFDGLTSLREAVIFANRQTGQDEITFASEVTNITLSQTLPTITGPTLITGPGADKLTVTRGEGTIPYSVLSFSGAATVSGLTIAGGIATYGGGIYTNAGGLIIRNCVFRGNRAGNGGGVYGASLVSNSTFIDNVATLDGGGFYSTNAPTLEQCTFWNNSSGQYGGGVYCHGSLLVRSSTFVRNRANTRNTISIPIIAGGGVYGYGVQLNNTLLAENYSGPFGTPDDTGTSLIFSGSTNNLISSGNSLSTFFGSNIIGTAMAPVDAKVAEIANNGGPIPTVALLPNSPALNAGADTITGSTSLATDARGSGYARKKGAAIDIGAFEAEANIQNTNIPPVFNDLSLVLTQGMPFSNQLGATDNDGDTLKYGIVAGYLPEGLTLSSSGLISGTPTMRGTTQVSIGVSDNRGGIDTATITLRVSLGTVGALGGQIAFASTRDANSEIYIMNADGSVLRNLTQNPASDSQPTLSPDGTKVAFVTNRNVTGSALPNSDIYVVNTDGTGTKQITFLTTTENEPAFSPDGRKIAFTSNRNGNYDVYIMNADGTNDVRLTSNGADDGSPTWSPDGRKLAFTSNRTGSFEIYTINADGTKEAALTRSGSLHADPEWSSDGRISYAVMQNGNFDIYSINPDGTDEVRLTSHGALDRWPAWSPDNSKIAFTSARNGDSTGLYVMNADGSGQTRLSAPGVVDSYPSWAPGEVIYNAVPFVSSTSISTSEDVAKDIKLEGYDPLARGLTYTIVSPTAYGTLTGTNNQLRYTPSPNYYGTDSFTFKASNGVAESSIATVSLTINAVNDIPSISQISEQTINAGGSTGNLPFTIGDVETDVNSLVVSAEAMFSDLVRPEDIQLGGSGANRFINITSPTTGTGNVFILIKVSDGVNTALCPFYVKVKSATSPTPTPTPTLTPTSTPTPTPTPTVAPNTAPFISQIPDQAIAEDGSLDDLPFTVNDAQSPSSEITLVVTSTNQNVVEDEEIEVKITPDSATGNRLLNITPVENANGWTTIVLIARDPQGLTTRRQFQLSVVPVNDAPIADTQTILVESLTSVTGQLTGFDIENDALTFSLLRGPSVGNLTLSPNGTFTYLPSKSFGSQGDKFTFIATDSQNATSESATIFLQPKSSESLTVTTIADEVKSDTKTSLREALNYANSIGGGIISFALPGKNVTSQTLTLKAALPVITSPISVNNTGLAPIILKGPIKDRIFEVGSQGSLNLRAMQLMGGQAFRGGGVLNQGQLTLDGCTFVENFGSSVGNVGQNATVQAQNTTFAAKRASGSGSAIFNDGGKASFVNCTFVADKSVKSPLTFVSNGQISFWNTILDAGGGESVAQAGENEIRSFGHNLLSDYPRGWTYANGDQLGQVSKLAPLTYTKGDPVWTCLLQTGSPARNKGDSAVFYSPYGLRQDARYQIRLQSVAVDLGAVEMPNVAPAGSDASKTKATVGIPVLFSTAWDDYDATEDMTAVQAYLATGSGAKQNGPVLRVVRSGENYRIYFVSDGPYGNNLVDITEAAANGTASSVWFSNLKANLILTANGTIVINWAFVPLEPMVGQRKAYLSAIDQSGAGGMGVGAPFGSLQVAPAKPVKGKDLDTASSPSAKFS